MAESDILYVLLLGFILILLLWIFDYTHDAFFAKIGPMLDPAQETALNDSWDSTVSFFDMSFAAMLIIFALAAIALTILLASHPVFLLVWLFFSMVLFFIWDTTVDVLDAIGATVLNTHVADNALAFYENDLPKAFMLINILLAGVFLGKRVIA